MQNLKSLLADWILAPKTLSAIKYIASRIESILIDYRNVRNYPIEYARILDRNIKLRNIYQGKRCFVIGNGPSINRQDLSLLKNEINIVCNAFFNHEILKEWQPTIYCAGDPWHPSSLSFLLDIFDKINPLFYVFDYSLLEFLANDGIQIPSVIRDKILGFATYSSLYRDHISEQIQIDFTRPVPGIRHTPMLSIMIAMYMGCNPIILIGCDHDYVYKFFRQEYEVTHFYPESTPEMISSDQKYISVAQDILKTYGSYAKLNQIALKRGVSILDATDNGCLDTFNKVDYTSLFK
ncbi:DUF115 domain-containing protein [Anabaena aphanizomenioides LEGE 00250]|uniref:DUF115 domain-containing protein n=1 Tax=Sphaerospermopsis aphanizomenoides LEGE 00250 TaxID=2777972 RepID=A0ABR9VF18_9CYAN|nr:6-hydroxymethylpterin diphosphokinase MptE-like protein [Sphaerospermopsis aphanizomenoides]MBE9236780.1 DUF115 domain-containing protein [Sphaerospermopsis aphanizomenoides LEGE 00250]